MPVTLEFESRIVAEEMPPRKKWTRAECEFLDTHGLMQGQRYELIEGELIDKMGMGKLHRLALALVIDCLFEIFGRLRVQSQVPIDVSPEDNPTNEPQPDVVVYRGDVREIHTDNAQPSDILLAVEISDSTLSFDRTIKARLYARAGIPEHWILDLTTRRLIVHRDPANGAYASVVAYREQESVAPVSTRDRAVAVSAMLP